MTESQKIQKELDAFNASRKAVKKVESDFQEIKRFYTYRKSISIRSL